ncbi:MAG: hypothetical protein ACI4SL_03165, partial [Candidatus Ornithospirochaeta sp.]
MKEIKSKSRFLLPIIVFVLVAILVSGTLYIRSSLMNLTMEERSNQLEEMVTQIRANLSNGLQTHWNLVEGLNNAIQGRHYGGVEELCRSIEEMEEVFCTEMYGSQIMLLDSQGTAYLKKGSVGIWNDVNHLIDGNIRH